MGAVINPHPPNITETLQPYQNVRENCDCGGKKKKGGRVAEPYNPYMNLPSVIDDALADQFDENCINAMSCSANFGVPGNSICQSNRVDGKQLTKPGVQSAQSGWVNAFGERYNGNGDYQDP